MKPTSQYHEEQEDEKTQEEYVKAHQSSMTLDDLIARLQALREQTSGTIAVMYLVHSDSEQYAVDKIDVVEADGAIAEKCWFDEGQKYILISSESV